MSLMVLFSVIVHFCEPHLTFIWPLITLHVCNDAKKRDYKNETNKSIVCVRALITYCMETIPSIWISFAEAEETEREWKETYDGTIARRKRVLVMAGIESHFA